MNARVAGRLALVLFVLLALTRASRAQPPDESTVADAARPRTDVPRPTDEDRKAAFPDVSGHEAHDKGIYYFTLFDRLEWQAGGDGAGAVWDNRGWVGGDRNRLWFRSEGETDDNRVETAHAHILYGRPFARWWDVVAGVKQDVRPGAAQTWAAVGVQGLAPDWFEIEATAYIGAHGRTHAKLDVEYDLLLTNRLILQPVLELDLYGRSDHERRIGAGLSRIETGLRLRYEVRRELAPYLGVAWSRAVGSTADFTRADGLPSGTARAVVGMRFWF